MNAEVKVKYESYPENIKPLLLSMRELILETAAEYEVQDLREALKWGEPSFICKGGSTVRLDWKERTPEKYYLFFICQTKLVETFRELYKNQLDFEGNRAIVLDINQVIPKKEIKHCISLALRYKSLKNLDLLGE